MQLHLLDDTPCRLIIPGMYLMRNFVNIAHFQSDLDALLAVSPLRSMTVPGGGTMSVSTSSCGHYGWTANNVGYAYDTHDPLTQKSWPPIPASWMKQATKAAALAGFPLFQPDTCLINRYTVGAQMGLHQDRNEADFTQPVVSFSYGADADFFFTSSGTRRGATQSVALGNGDALVFGGAARMVFHGIRPLRDSASTFQQRVNLTFRRVARIAEYSVRLAP